MGILLLQGKAQAAGIGLWLGYLIYGLLLPRQIYSHDYYNLLLVPIVALSIAPVAALPLAAMRRRSATARSLFLLLAIAALAYPAWVSRTTLLSRDYRGEAVGWKELSEDLPSDGSIIALTQKYGKRFKYYGFRQMATWPYLADLNLTGSTVGNPSEQFQQFFDDHTKDFRYFAITHFGEYNSQPALKSWLEENYQSFSPRESLLIFDLEQAKTGVD